MGEILLPGSEDLDGYNQQRLWFVNSLPKLAVAANATYNFDIKRTQAPLELYNKRKRALSEMPLCNTWEIIYPPLGMEVVEGSVVCDYYQYPQYHFFAEGQEDLIMCLFPGQFIDPFNQRLNRGVRLLRLKQQAPELITFSPETGLAMLLGKRDEIKKKLGLVYY